MSVRFSYQGFDVLSQWNGALVAADGTQAIGDIAAAGSNALGITTKLYLPSASASTVLTDPVKSTSDASLIAGAASARAKGLKVLLAPALIGYDGSASYQVLPSDPRAFFASYTAAMVHAAAVAQQAGVDTLSVGNEMGRLTGAAYRGYWLDLIAAVRRVYTGKITYKAAMNEAASVSFWDKVDTIGVNAYPILSASYTPSASDLQKAWTAVPTDDYWVKSFNGLSPVDFIHSLATTYAKQGLITETGYRSVLGTAINPPDGPPIVVADQASQATAYQALFQTMQAQGGSWLAGIMLWAADLAPSGDPTGFSPVGKQAMAVVQQFFSGSAAVGALSVAGSATGDRIEVGAGNDVIRTGLGDDVIKAGAGNDTILAGPAQIAPLTSTTVVITGYGLRGRDGSGAQIALWINGSQVGATATFTPAADPSGYQSVSITFANPYQVKTLDLALLNAASGAAAEIRGITINGAAVAATDTTNSSAPGTFALYHDTIHLDASPHQDWFYGARTDNDIIDGGAGNDWIDGGAGIDTAVYHGPRSAYALARSGNTLTVADSIASRDGTDTLTNVEYLQFSDQRVAIASLLLPTLGTTTVSGLMAPLVSGVTLAATPAASAVSKTIAVAPQLAVSGNTVAGAAVTLLNGSAVLATTSADGAGGYRFALGAVPEGIYTLATRAVLGTLSSGLSDATTVVVGTAARIAGLILSAPVVPRAVYVTDSDNPIVVSVAQLAALASGVQSMVSNWWVRVSDTAANVLAALDDLALRKHLGAITLTDTHVFQTSLATMRHVTTADASTLAMIEGGCTFAVTGTTPTGALSTSVYDVHGSLTSTTTVTKRGTQTETFVSYADGSTADTVVDANGAKLTESTMNAAGHSYTVYGITGKPYTRSVTLSDASGRLTSVTNLYADGSVYSQTIVAPDGSTSAQTFDTAGHLTQRRTATPDGNSHTTSYAVDGAVLTDTVVDATGTHWTQFGITGKPYTVMTVDNTPGGALKDIIQYNTDGSVSTTLYMGGVDLSFTHAADRIASAGQDTFRFPTTPFSDTIRAFHGGTAADHDTLVLSSSLATSFSALHVTTSGQTATVGIDARHAITFTELSGTLTPGNVRFV